MPRQLHRQLPSHRTFARLPPDDQRSYLIGFLINFITTVEARGRYPTPWEQYCFDRTVQFIRGGSLAVALNEIVLLLSPPLDHTIRAVRDLVDLQADIQALLSDTAVPSHGTRKAAPPQRKTT